MPNIILVEDDPFLIDIYKQKFESAGFGINVVKNGSKVLDALAQSKPDLLLLDIVLPEMAGWEVLEKIKAEPNYKDLKVVILSNLGQKEEVEKGLQMGADKYLIKSQYKPSEVVEKVKEILAT
ncbi:MAG: response regulator [Candidatus Gribaldobacteria bacterium]|nr:response regulator [Candidatus Gribaldobacteria bacterium]